jgi:putative ABC transport system substrate-binding protein
MRLVGVLFPGAADDPQSKLRIDAFEQGLKALGWSNGKNLHIIYRMSGADAERLRKDATELVGLNPEVILAPSTLALSPLQRATKTIPLVFLSLYDPVGSGFVSNLAHPDANITGFALGENTLGGKMLGQLKEIVPAIEHATVIFNPDQPPQVAMWHSLESTGPRLGVRMIAAPLREVSEIEPVVAAAAREPKGALVVIPSPVTLFNRDQLIALATRYRLPAIYGLREFALSGGLMSYGASLIEQYRSAAVYIDRILKGAVPADLPVQQPTKFELIVNLKAARAIGLDVPWSIQLRADEGIE